MNHQNWVCARSILCTAAQTAIELSNQRISWDSKIILNVSNVQTTSNLAISRCFCQKTAKKCAKNCTTRAQPLFCSLNLLFNRPSLCRRRCGFLKLSTEHFSLKWPMLELSQNIFWRVLAMGSCVRVFTSEKFENAALILRGFFYGNALHTGGIWKSRLFVFVWTENILRKKHSKTMTSR